MTLRKNFSPAFGKRKNRKNCGFQNVALYNFFILYITGYRYIAFLTQSNVIPENKGRARELTP